MTLIEFIKKIGRIPDHIRYEYGYARIIFYRILFGFHHSKTKVWLFMERGFDAQDNAWHLFKYVVREHPEISVRYAIHKNSPDYDSNLKGFEKYVIEYDSFEYYMYLFNAKAIVSTHVDKFTSKESYSERFRRSFWGLKSKIIFLQHGIIRQDCPEFEFPNYDMDLFVSGANNEYRLLNKLYHYPSGYIVYTGLPRFDNLLPFKTKSQILIMPTWRKKYHNISIEQFLQTDFFQIYADLLSDEKLIKTLRDKGYSIQFYNHFEFQKYNTCFEKFNNDVIHIRHFGEQRVQELLKESDVLVTDYSSIYYDFMYMEKPVCFLQFDYEDFEKSQYGKMYDYCPDFGNVQNTAYGMANVLIELLNNGCQMEQKYKDKVAEIFTYRDTNNCKRVYECIVDKLK